MAKSPISLSPSDEIDKSPCLKLLPFPPLDLKKCKTTQDAEKVLSELTLIFHEFRELLFKIANERFSLFVLLLQEQEESSRNSGQQQQQ